MAVQIQPRIIVRLVENNFCWGCSLCGAKIKECTPDDNSYPNEDTCCNCGKEFIK